MLDVFGIVPQLANQLSVVLMCVIAERFLALEHDHR
ncbi:Uncharacterised protein [Mycobacteroides abscessus subsp. abscessus]|nr:Uncharacterised protein [Mycobacteroides abscessus subsp. abscessus]